MSKHTPEQWKWEGPTEPAKDNDADGFYRGAATTYLSGPNGEPIIVPWDYESYSVGLYVSQEHARLIAAAPDLLAVLGNAEKWIQGLLRGDPEQIHIDTILQELRTAIAKAKP